MKISDFLVKHCQCPSYGQVRRHISHEALRLNGDLVTDMDQEVSPGDKVGVGPVRFWIVGEEACEHGGCDETVS